ncbi:MAG: SPOR domain-containing protein, partial [Lachnospiraceae bacterium]|nr:SPOR domain-containing protein [Lachnospiraceae bacterium]
VIFCIALAATAQMRANDSLRIALSPNLLDSMPGVEVLQDSAVGVLLQTALQGKMDWVEIDGYRVQIYSSNQQQAAKSEALDLEDRIKEKIDQPVYVLYIPPFWKVRLGDFRTYEEAREYKKLFVDNFPEVMGDTYIVRDKIQVLQ